MIRLLAIATLLLTCRLAAAVDVYRCTAADGTMYYSASPAKGCVSINAPSAPAQPRQLPRFAYSCQSNSHKCQAVCDAATELESAANELARCARRHDFSNDCSRQARDSRNAADDYESAVMDAEDDCD